MKNKFLKTFNIEKVSIVKYCGRDCSACGGYYGSIGYDSCKQNISTPPMITPEIILNLEDIALNNDFILTKIPHPNEVFGDDLYLWVDSTNLNRQYCHTAEKLRVNAVLSLLINIKEDVYNDVREIFNGK